LLKIQNIAKKHPEETLEKICIESSLMDLYSKRSLCFRLSAYL